MTTVNNESMMQGDTAVFQASLSDASGTPVNDPTAEYRLTVKTAYSDADGSAIYTATALQSTAGVAFLTIDPSDLATLTPPAVLVYDVKVQETSGQVTTVSRGKFTVLPAVRDVMP